MKQFIKERDDQGSKLYVNSDFIISVRPEDWESFEESGAIVTVQKGTETEIHVIAVGEDTQQLLGALGIG